MKSYIYGKTIIFATNNPRNKYLLNSSVYLAKQLWQTLPSEIK